MSNNKKKAIASLVLGILGLVGGWFGSIPIIGVILSSCTLIFSIIATVLGAKARKAGGDSKGMATAGLVLGIIGIVLGAIGFVCGLCAAGAACIALGA